MLTNRQNILVTSGNLAPKTSGKLFNSDGSINLLPGQIGLFNAKTHTAVANVSGGNEYYIAVGIDADGDGITDTLRKSAGEEISKCGVDAAQVKAPVEECPEIWDFVFDCVECNTDYALKVQTEGVEWMPYFANQHLPTFTFNVFTECCTECEEETPTYACSAFVNEILEQISQTRNEAANLIDQQYPFDAIALTGNSTAGKTVTITVPCYDGRPAAIADLVVNTTAGGSVAYTDLCTNAADYPTVLSNGTINPGQLSALAAALEAHFALDDNNVKITFYKACTNGCYHMVITGNDIVTISGQKFLDEGEACGGSDGVNGSTLTTDTPLTVDGVDYTCGIRFIGHIFPQECGCFPPKEYKSTRGTKMRVFPASGFDCKWAVNQVQELSIAQGQGADLRWLEYKQQTGGVGRVYDSYHMHYGKLGVYGDRVRESVTAACVPYCKYDLIHHTKSNPLAPMGWTNNTHLLTTIAIPSDDSATLAFETQINALIGAGTCTLHSLACGSDAAEETNSNLN